MFGFSALSEAPLSALPETGAAGDALVADNLATGAPTVGTPAIAQSHSLVASNLATGAPTVGSPLIGQIHALAATGVSAGPPTVGSPAVGQNHVLTATGIATGAPTVGSPELTDVDATPHDLLAEDLYTGPPTVGTPSLNGAGYPAILYRDIQAPSAAFVDAKVSNISFVDVRAIIDLPE